MARIRDFTSIDQLIADGEAAEAALFARMASRNGVNALFVDLEAGFDDYAEFDENIVKFPSPPHRLDAPRGNLEAALRYADAGAAVFAAGSSNDKALDKRPIFVRSWSAESTRDHATIKRFFKDSTALVAVDCGKSRIVVIDADRHGGPDGVAALKEIVGGDLMALGCPIIETAGGGLHLVFAQPFDGKPFGNGEGALKGRGINVRGAGGYVIGLGSVRHDGRCYSQMAGAPDLFDALSNGTLPQVPEALADLIRAPKETLEEPERAAPRPASTPNPSYNSARERTWALAKLDARAAELARAGEGGRNNALNEAAHSLGRVVACGWLGETEVRAALEDACRQNGLWKEDGPNVCRATLTSGLRAGMANPHPGLPEREVSPEDQDALRHGDEIAAQAKKQRERIFVDGDEIDPETGEVLHEAASNNDDFTRSAEEAPCAEEPQPKREERRDNRIQIETINAASLAGKPVPRQEWLIKDLIPKANVTMLAGDGATGKSLLGLQLAVAVASGGGWIGFRPEIGRALYLSAEDELDEVHRRLVRMVPRLEMLGNLNILPLAGMDAVLAAPVGREGLLKETPLFVAVRRVIQKHRPDFLVLDTLADIFGGDEIKKVHARQFVAMLRSLALEYGVTVLLLSHPSQAGMNSGTGTSGNSAWNNSVRSRLYFERRITRDGFKSVEDDTNIRVLKTMKSNRAAIGGQIVVRYAKGMFIREETSNLNARDAAHQAECVFLELLAKFKSQGRNLSPTPCAPTYAPTTFAKDDQGNGITKRAFEQAMSRLFTAGRIVIAENGPPSKRRQTIVLAPHEAGEPAMSGEDDDVIGAESAEYPPAECPEPPD